MNTRMFLFRTLACAWVALPISFASAGSAVKMQLTPGTVNDMSLVDPVDGKAPRTAILRAQVLLDRAHFSPGEIDAAYGKNLRDAIAAYQAANGLDPVGTIDGATWASLNRDEAPALSAYQITDADVVGPFDAIPEDMMAKAKLPALGFTSPIEALAEKFHASPKLLQRLNPDKDFSRVGEDIVVPDVATSAPLPAVAKIVVDQSDSSVSLLDGADQIVARYPASTGSEHDPLPIGEWKVDGINKNPVFHYNPALFWDADPKHAQAEIPPGPNNPVGVVWIGLSKDHYGIHGTPEPAKIGKTESHGCIRLTNWDATALADATKSGLPVTLQE